MTEPLNLGEIDIVIVAKNHNPSILNPDFLLRTGIVREDWGWDLAMSPISTPQFSQVVYKSGVSIQAFLEKLIFRYRTQEGTPTGARLSNVVRKYVESVPHVTYAAFGVNPKAHLLVESEEKAARYILDRLVSNGPWKTFATGPADASLTLAYKIADCLISLAISTGKVTSPDKTESACIVFAGNFHRDLGEGTHEAKHAQLLDLIGKWEDDCETFKRLIHESFLAQEKTA